MAKVSSVWFQLSLPKKTWEAFRIKSGENKWETEQKRKKKRNNKRMKEATNSLHFCGKPSNVFHVQVLKNSELFSKILSWVWFCKWFMVLFRLSSLDACLSRILLVQVEFLSCLHFSFSASNLYFSGLKTFTDGFEPCCSFSLDK